MDLTDILINMGVSALLVAVKNQSKRLALRSVFLKIFTATWAQFGTDQAFQAVVGMIAAAPVVPPPVAPVAPAGNQQIITIGDKQYIIVNGQAIPIQSTTAAPAAAVTPNTAPPPGFEFVSSDTAAQSQSGPQTFHGPDKSFQQLT